MFSTLASIAWLTSAMSVPDGVISASSAKNDMELLGVSGMTTVLTSLSGYLTKSYYNDQNCKTLIYADGTKLGACVLDPLGNAGYTILTADQNKIIVSSYTTKDCSVLISSDPMITYTDGACNSDLTAFRVSATRGAPTAGFMTRSVKIICS